MIKKTEIVYTILIMFSLMQAIIMFDIGLYFRSFNSFLFMLMVCIHFLIMRLKSRFKNCEFYTPVFVSCDNLYMQKCTFNQLESDEPAIYVITPKKEKP